MKDLKQIQLETLNETVEFYSVDPNGRRAFNAENFGQCHYKTSDGRKCAVGRLFKRGEYSEKYGSTTFINLPLKKGVKRLRDTYGVDFLQTLQKLHDTSTNWNNDGLSEIGKREVEYLKIKFNLN